MAADEHRSSAPAAPPPLFAREEELQLIARCLERIEQRTPECGEQETRSSVTRYTDAARFERELSELFCRTPTMIAHESELAQPGSFVTTTRGRRPLLVARDRQGRARAFFNVCRHRGTQLVSAPSGCAMRWTCPYHAWTYGCDGALLGVPHGRGFPTLDRSANGLVELPTAEAHGFIWLIAEPGEQLDLDRFLGSAGDRLAALGCDRLRTYAPVSQRWQANWKLLVEGGLEAYHFRFAHERSVYPLVHDNIQIYDWFGPHFRAVIPKRTLAELAQRERSSWSLRPHANVTYTMFPGHSLLVQPDHIAWIAISPLGVDATELVLTMLIPDDPASDRAERHWQRNHQLLIQTLSEDFTLAQSIQRGLASGANSELRFGRFEHALAQFNRLVDRALDGGVDPETSRTRRTRP